MKKFIVSAALIICALSLVGCGGGGGGSSSGSTPDPPILPPTTKITGTGSKSPVSGATVTAYKIVNALKDAVLGSTKTGATGSYTLDLGTYTGPVLLEMSGGTYTDEATGNPNATIPVGAPLRALVSNVSGTVSVAITPLTELACQLAGSSLNPTAIVDANSKVSSLFKVYDIISTQPVAPTSSVLNALPATIKGQDQRDYTLVLATISQIAKSQNKTVADTINYLFTNISGSKLNPAAASAVQIAAAEYFSTTNTNNKTGVTSPASTNIVLIGARKAIVKLSTSGTLLPANSVRGISFAVNLPAGITVKSDANGVLASYLSASSVNSTIIGNSAGSKLTINLINTDGIFLGEFANLNCDVAYDAADPVAGSFTITGSQVSDLTGGNSVPLASVSVVVLGVTIQ